MCYSYGWFWSHCNPPPFPNIVPRQVCCGSRFIEVVPCDWSPNWSHNYNSDEAPLNTCYVKRVAHAWCLCCFSNTENSSLSYCLGISSPSSLGLPIQEEAMDAYPSATQGTHYHVELLVPWVRPAQIQYLVNIFHTSKQSHKCCPARTIGLSTIRATALFQHPS